MLQTRCELNIWGIREKYLASIPKFASVFYEKYSALVHPSYFAFSNCDLDTRRLHAQEGFSPFLYVILSADMEIHAKKAHPEQIKFSMRQRMERQISFCWVNSSRAAKILLCAMCLFGLRTWAHCVMRNSCARVNKNERERERVRS